MQGTDSEGADPILNIIRQSVSQLCLSAFGFPQLPPEVLWHSHHLIKLDLSSNQLTSLPDSLAELTVLQVLNLDKNHFIVLPAPVCQLPELQVLQIGQNDLKSLPASVSRLQHLKMLSFSRNEVSELPEAVCQMTSLRALPHFTTATKQNKTIKTRSGQLAGACKEYLRDKSLGNEEYW